MASPLSSEAVVRKHFAVLRRRLPPAARGDADAVHRARVATRRLREVLSLFGEAGRPRRRLLRKVRRITRVLGPVRELDVALDNLRRVERDARGSRGGTRRLRQALELERRARRRDLRKTVARANLAKLRKRALRVVRRATEASEGEGAGCTDLARQHAGLRARQLRATIEQAGRRFRPDLIHEVRIALKKLRYALEATADVGGARALGGATGLEQGQELLGTMHDLQVLIQYARDVQATSGGARPGDWADVRRLVRRLETERGSLHRRYLDARPGLLAVCARAEGRAGHLAEG